ncbi:helix-turn-helix domain-containing protein [Bacillus sp. S/N-304-OC-R1]|uniref:helix-turn-helix domain-containing protein n=1 Tax=Bacillus sp. S/N-304-OC-R1 TaxID=2758034 RepID=UPI001C8E341E|nr:helix-turn-helix domain-containing protein [Bacillus sp. S/N-304-OC-R1]MBY0123155.1 helix-turn-helix domain-containing protein [Bacillus sp. S/N-304-OC-R1]
MEYQIGKKIKELRKYWHMTQEELADGICSQGLISKIEKNEEIHLSAQLLHQISQRLGVSIEYFFLESDLPRLSYINDICDQITELIRSKQYEEAYPYVKLQKNNPSFEKKPHLKQFLLWREAICINYVEKDKEKALKLINEALSYSKTGDKIYSLRELDILISKAIIYGELNQWELARELYTKILNYADKLPYLTDRTIFINIYYNFSQASAKIKNYDHALYLCNKGITMCKEIKTYYLLGSLYYQKAQILYDLEQQVTADVIMNYKQALWVFENSNDHKNYEDLCNKLKSLNIELSLS